MFKYITHPMQYKLPVMNRGGRVPGMYYNGGESPSVMRRYLQNGNGEEVDFSNIDLSGFNFTPPNPNDSIPSDTVSELSSPVSEDPLQYMKNQEKIQANQEAQDEIDRQARLDASAQGDYSAYKWKETYPELVSEWNPTGVNYMHNNPRPATIDIPHQQKAFINAANRNPVAGMIKGIYNTFKTTDL